MPILWDKHGKCAKQHHGKHMAKDGSRLVQTDDTYGQIITIIPTKKETPLYLRFQFHLFAILGVTKTIRMPYAARSLCRCFWGWIYHFGYP